jgi:hypothetical protein
MPGQYAAATDVSSEQSAMEIQRTLKRYKATSFMYGYAVGKASIAFSLPGVMIRIEIEMPDPDADEFRLTPQTRRVRTRESQAQAYEQAVRQRWRALSLVVKAKLEAVESGISTVQKEFLSFIVVPGGETVGDKVIPRLAHHDGSAHYQLMPGSSE